MTWQHDEFLAALADVLPNVRLLSLDVFDTLLFRACEQPEDVFHEVGRRAEAAGLLRHGVRAAEFAALRRIAQDTTYGTLGREPRLEDIYEALPATLCDRTATLALEMDVEAETCALNPSVDALVRQCNDNGIPVVLLSDMYLGGDRVRHLLACAGFDVETRVDRLIVSVDVGAYKMTGALYERLRDLYPAIPAASMLHVGDNVHSDVRMARAAGLQAVHYDVVRHDPDGTHAAERLVHRAILPEMSYPRRLAASLGAKVPSADRGWFRTGAQVAGPFAAALVEWTLDLCEAEGVTLVAPLMREAHVLAPMLRRAAAARGTSLAIEPLYVSRHAVALAGIADVGQEMAGVLLDHRRGVTIAELYAMVDLAVPEHIAAHADVAIQHAHAVDVGGQSLRNWVAGHIACDDVRPHLEQVVASARTRLAEYLHQIIGQHEKVATLDVGFYGNIQRALSETLGRTGSTTHFVHLLAFAHGPTPARMLRGLDVRAFAGGYGDDSALVRTIHRSAPVIEQLLQGPEGTTAGYRCNGHGRVEPIIETNPLPERDLEAKAIVQAGMTAFHELWLSLRRSRPASVLRVLDRRPDWCRLVHRLIQAPTHAEAARLGTLHDDVNYGSTDVLPFCPEATEHAVAWRGADAVVREGLNLPVVWPQGVVTRVDAGALLAPHAAISDVPYAPAAVALARALRARGLTRVIGYGTGDVAHAFVDAARMIGIDITALVDSQPRLHGLCVRGIPVCSLDDAVTLGIHVYTVFSLAHATPISATIRHRYSREAASALILDLTTSLAR